MSSDLEREIYEQPAVLRRMLSGREKVAATASAWADDDRINSVLIAARGTSDNAARYGQYLLGAYNQLQVGLATPSLFSRYGRPPKLKGMLVGAISQSGRSPDVVGVVAEANRQGQPTFAITNDVESPLATEADATIDLMAGRERSVAATKTYTTSLAAIASLSVGMSSDDRATELDAIPGVVAETIDMVVASIQPPDWLVNASSCVVVSRGFNYSTAYETALKIKELTALPTEAYSSADFLHGPIAAVRAGVPTILIAPTSVMTDDLAEVAQRVKAQQSPLVVISDDASMLETADVGIALPRNVPEWLSPLNAIIPGQVMAWKLAVARGMDLDQPEGLQKVTETH